MAEKVGICGTGGWRSTSVDEIIDAVIAAGKRTGAFEVNMIPDIPDATFGPKPRNRAERRRAKYGKRKR
ncbi:MAG: hypothetical protein NC311_05650 [Muribaculaceae bacterium]|nr:hypothetical protein [Muribaculaceae bacterium]